MDLSGSFDDANYCLSVVSAKGASGYDAQELFSLVEERALPQSYAALVLLINMMGQLTDQHLIFVKKQIHTNVLEELLHNQPLQVTDESPPTRS